MKPQTTKPQSRLRIYDANGDTSKRWYLEITTIKGKRRIRRQLYEGINETNDPAKRRKAAKALRLAVSNLLDQGWDPTAKSSPVQVNEPVQDALGRKLTQLKGSLRPSTWETYGRALKTFRRYIDETHVTETMATFGRDQARRYMDWLRMLDNVENTTRNAYARQIRSLFGHCLEENPFRAVKMLKERRKRNAPIPAVHMAMILDEMQRTNPGLRMFFEMMYYCGIRRGELCGLRVHDIHPEDRAVLLRAAITKNGMDAFVRVPDVFWPKLLSWIEGADPHAWLFGGHMSPGPSIPRPNTYTRGTVRVIQRLGLKEMNYSLYSARHTSAKALATAGVNLLDISAHLRHSSPRVTEFYLRDVGGRISEKLATTFPELPATK